MVQDTLRRYFDQIAKLYKYQGESLDRVLDNTNTLTIAPTGKGKSLVFQLAGLKMKGTTIVVSPLKALMNEQVNTLISRDINAIAFNSDKSFIEQRKILRNLKYTKPKFIYVSPERLFNYFFRSALKFSGIDINLVVIDEAHCISQWGIDFRPDYGNIMPFIEFLNNKCEQHPTILALTATLGNEAREDILKEFNIHKNDVVIDKGIIRKDLHLNFLKVKQEEEKIERIKGFINDNNLSKVLVYLYSRKKCETFSDMVSDSGFFHARVPAEKKDEVYRKFKEGKIKILFATTAFGMGINIPDIDGVIHMHLPGSVEEYYQHVGRGARNNNIVKTCHCLLVWSDTNFDRKKGRIQGETLTEDDLHKGYKHLAMKNKKQGDKTYIKFEEIYKNDGSYGSVKLSLIKRMFEKYKICKTIGDIYGNPKDIIFKVNTELWKKVLHKLRVRNQFLLAERLTGIALEELIDHVYKEELKGNIEKLPARKRILFIEKQKDSLDKYVITKILEESKEVEEFKISQLEQLYKLVTSDDPSKHIARVLDVPYK
ncbi:MAG: RecQ family ATP-dependent DNA helicase [bacterium]